MKRAIDEMILATLELDAAFERGDVPTLRIQLGRLKAGADAYRRLAGAERKLQRGGGRSS